MSPNHICRLVPACKCQACIWLPYKAFGCHVNPRVAIFRQRTLVVCQSKMTARFQVSIDTPSPSSRHGALSGDYASGHNRFSPIRKAVRGQVTFRIAYRSKVRLSTSRNGQSMRQYFSVGKRGYVPRRGAPGRTGLVLLGQPAITPLRSCSGQHVYEIFSDLSAVVPVGMVCQQAPWQS
jgi:hypothetical protein